MNPVPSLTQRIMAGDVIRFVAEGTQVKEKARNKNKKKNKNKNKSTKANLPEVGPWGYDSSFKVNPNTGRTMDMFADQDWALCDKDCGWCGHCNE